MSPAGTQSEDQAAPPGEGATIPQAERRPDSIYRYLRELILDGRLEPGTVLSQVALARSLGVSRPPLREALRRLQQEGLVRAEYNRRARVTAFNADELEFVYCNRILLGALAAAVTVPRLTGEDLFTIDAALDDMHAASGAGDEAGYEVAHQRLHGAFIMRAEDRLKREIAAFAARGDRYRRLYRFTVPGAPGHGAVEHQAIRRRVPSPRPAPRDDRARAAPEPHGARAHGARGPRARAGRGAHRAASGDGAARRRLIERHDMYTVGQERTWRSH